MKKKYIYFTAASLVLVAAVVVINALGIGTYPPMTGTVVDEETGKPIEGAVVLVEWTKTHGIGDHHTASYKVEEAVTDKEGKFTVPGLDERAVNSPNLTVYKKGYIAWNSRLIFPSYVKRADFKWGKSVFRLHQLTKDITHNEHALFIETTINSAMNMESKQSIYNAFRWEERLAFEERERLRKK